MTPPVPSASTPPPAPDSQELAEKLGELVEEARSDVLGRITGVNGATEREVLAVGSSLQAIVNEAQSQVTDLRGTLELLGGSGARVGVPQLAARQSESVHDYLERMGEIIAAHDATVQTSEAASKRILNIGRNVEKVAFQARLLSLNASIEAARLGGTGSAFGVIAEEMTRLSKEMDAANRQVRDLAQTLLESIPEIGRQSAEMRGVSAEFSERMREELTELQRSSGDFEQRISQALKRGDQCSARVVERSREALSHLSFQDACAQRLLSVDEVLRRLATRVQGALGDPSATATRNGYADVQRNDAFFAGEVVALRPPQEGEDEAIAAPGEMMLF